MTRKRYSRISLYLPEGMISEIDVLVGFSEQYTSRSEFIRAGVEMLLILEIIKDDKVVHLAPAILEEARKEARLPKEG